MKKRNRKQLPPKSFSECIGVKFGRLTVLRPISVKIRKKIEYIYCECLCDCGNICKAEYRCMMRGKSKSCGCYGFEQRLKSVSTHSSSYTSVYKIWYGITRRCIDPKNHAYNNYGGRGINVCERWLEPKGKGFLNFLSDMGERPSLKHTIDRIDNNGNYCPENCRWATEDIQSRNKRTNVRYEYNGKSLVQTDWAILFKVARITLRRYVRIHGFEKAYIHYTTHKRRKNQANYIP